MVSIVLASHGKFAEGIMESGQMIFGSQKDVAAVTLTPDMGPDDLKAKLKDAVASFDEQEHVLFLSTFGAPLPSTRSTACLRVRATRTG